MFNILTLHHLLWFEAISNKDRQTKLLKNIEMLVIRFKFLIDKNCHILDVLHLAMNQL